MMSLFNWHKKCNQEYLDLSRECRDEIEKNEEMLIARCVDLQESRSQLIDVTKERDSYKCALDLKIGECEEAKAVYNYKVSELEEKLKTLEEDRETLTIMVRELRKNNEIQKASELISKSYSSKKGVKK